MRAFPGEFSDLLTTGARSAKFSNGRAGAGKPTFVLREGLIDRETARACARLLDKHLYPLLRPVTSRIPPDSISGMKRNYSEQLPKTMRMKSCFLHSKRCLAYPQAEKIGLMEMLRSASLTRFAEEATGLHVEPSSYQVICYGHGDYAGPHNDHHPETDQCATGFVDLHIMFSNDAVDHHWLVYEENGHFTQIRDINLEGGVAVYKLPFWHYTTPLAAKPGREDEARRWLLLVSYDILDGT